MPRIQIPTQTYELNSLPADAQDLLNLYVEPLPPGARSPAMLRSTPGLTELFDFSAGGIRALDATQPGRLYAVAGNQFIRYTAEGGAVSIGTVGSAGRPTIAAGPTAVIVCTPPTAYIASHNLDAGLNQIDLQFPDGASSVTYLDGYWVFTRATSGSDQFFWSNLLDGNTYDGLSFASADARPNVLKRAMTHRGALWLFGDAGVEIWDTTGDANAPFARASGGDIAFGCAAGATVAECDNSLFWLGTNGIVYQSNGYNAQRVSTFAIEEWIRDFGRIENATALSYVQQGHAFYCLSFQLPDGTGGRTWVYDAATKVWHRRASYAGGTGRWLADCSTQFGGTAIFGDGNTPTVHALDPQTRTDAGQILRRIACFPPIWAETKRGFMSRFEVECDVGTQAANPSMQIDWSDNGGRTFKTPRFLDTGASGQHNARAYTNRLGMFEHRVLRLQAEDIVTIYGADVEMSRGE